MRLIKHEKLENASHSFIKFNGDDYIRICFYKDHTLSWFMDKSPKDLCSDAFSMLLEEVYNKTIQRELRQKKLERVCLKN